MITRITTIWPTNIQLDCKDKAKRIVDMQKKDSRYAKSLRPATTHQQMSGTIFCF